MVIQAAAPGWRLLGRSCLTSLETGGSPCAVRLFFACCSRLASKVSPRTSDEPATNDSAAPGYPVQGNHMLRGVSPPAAPERAASFVSEPKRQGQDGRQPMRAGGQGSDSRFQPKSTAPQELKPKERRPNASVSRPVLAAAAGGRGPEARHEAPAGYGRAGPAGGGGGP